MLITSDNKVISKIQCLPNHSYDMYFDKKHWIDNIAFTFDFDSKEYAINLLSFKYSNSVEEIKPAKINLKDYINIKKKIEIVIISVFFSLLMVIKNTC